MSFFTQAAFRVRLEWGAAAIEQLAGDVECVVVVDVMSFTTCVSIAVDRGIAVYPYPAGDDAAAAAYAQSLGALLAGNRLAPAQYSLSPASLLSAPPGLKLVLPSPNGSAACHATRQLGAAVFGGCLRNMTATAAACAPFSSILVVPCGERWADGSLRPCVEDYLAAGGIIAALDDKSRSAEARAAAAAFNGLAGQRRQVLSACSSAVELTQRGFETDVALCLDEDVSQAACPLGKLGYFQAVH